MMNKLFLILLSSILIISIIPVVSASEFFLKQTIFEGDSEMYDVGGYAYEVKLLSVFDSKLEAQFEVNGESTDFMSEDETYRFSDGSAIQVRDIMPQEAGDGKDLVQYNFFPAEHTESKELTEQQEVESVGVEPAVQPAEISAVEPEPVKEVRAAPPTEAKIDITKKKSADSWWESMIKWLKSLFS